MPTEKNTRSQAESRDPDSLRSQLEVVVSPSVYPDILNRIEGTFRPGQPIAVDTLLADGDEAHFFIVDPNDKTKRIAAPKEIAAQSVIDDLVGRGRLHKLPLNREDGEEELPLYTLAAFLRPGTRTTDESSAAKSKDRVFPRPLAAILGRGVVERVVQDTIGSAVHYYSDTKSIPVRTGGAIKNRGSQKRRRYEDAAILDQNRKAKQDERERTRSTKLRYAYSPEELEAVHKPIQTLEEAQITGLVDELMRLDSVLSSELNKRYKERCVTSGKRILPRDEYRDLREQVTDEVVVEYMGTDATQEDIDNMKIQLRRMKAQRR